MRNNDWLPLREQDLSDLLTKWNKWLNDSTKRAAFDWDDTECSALALKIGNFLTASSEYRAVDSTAHLIVKKVAKKIVVAAVRNFANSYIRFNRKMMAEDKLFLGIHERSTHKTPQASPTDHVDFLLSLDAQSHSVRADYRIDGEVGHSKGRYHGVGVRFWVLPLDAPPPITADDSAWRSEVNTATPWKHTFDSSDLGMRLHIAMRWENNSVGKGPIVGWGPWSAIRSVVIV
jgi:hypothetical protein